MAMGKKVAILDPSDRRFLTFCRILGWRITVAGWAILELARKVHVCCDFKDVT
jgi:hypothetical protein